MTRTKKALTLGVFVALVALGAIAGCKNRSIATLSSGMDAHSNADPFPASGVIDGWVKTDETRTYKADDLWQYIDGDAEQYLRAGVVSAATSGYKFHGQLEAVVDVYTMKDAAGAQKILETGLTKEAKTVALGDEGTQYAQSVIFRKGPALVRIVAYENTPETSQALLNLAHAVEAKL